MDYGVGKKKRSKLVGILAFPIPNTPSFFTTFFGSPTNLIVPVSHSLGIRIDKLLWQTSNLSTTHYGYICMKWINDYFNFAKKSPPLWSRLETWLGKRKQKPCKSHKIFFCDGGPWSTTYHKYKYHYKQSKASGIKKSKQCSCLRSLYRVLTCIILIHRVQMEIWTAMICRFPSSLLRDKGPPTALPPWMSSAS